MRERKRMGGKKGSKRNSRNNKNREKELKINRKMKWCKKSRKRKTMRNVVMSSHPHPAACGSAERLRSRRGLIQPFLRAQNGSAMLLLVPSQTG